VNLEAERRSEQLDSAKACRGRLCPFGLRQFRITSPIFLPLLAADAGDPDASKAVSFDIFESTRPLELLTVTEIFAFTAVGGT
jgi:hypothetical protein